LAVAITTIPLPYRPGFALIKQMPQSDFDSIATALEKAQISGGLKGLASTVLQQVPTLKRDEVESILRTVFSLSALVTDEESPLSENISSLTTAMQTANIPDLALSNQQRAEFEKRLARLLQIKNLTLASKVRRLETDFPKTFHDALVVTDMRPVFDRPEERPVGAAITHTLEITYHEDGEHKDFYVVLDAEDIETLKKVLQRAEAKASSLKAFLKSANLPDLS